MGARLVAADAAMHATHGSLLPLLDADEDFVNRRMGAFADFNAFWGMVTSVCHVCCESPPQTMSNHPLDNGCELDKWAFMGQASSLGSLLVGSSSNETAHACS